jgi:hypothetical protein
MRISELLKENELNGPQVKQPASNLPSAASIDDQPQEFDGEVDDTEDENVDSEREFKESAANLGDGLFALSAWSYPDAWTGGGYSDMRMHAIAALADETGSDLGDYEHITDQHIVDERRLEVAVYNQQTQVVFRLSAAAATEEIEFMPDLTTLQQTGSVTNSQMSKLKQIEATVRTWVGAVPEEFEGSPTDRRWAAAEKKVTGLFAFGGGTSGSGDHPEQNDPNHPEFGANSDVYSAGDKQAGDEFMAKLIAQKRAEREAKATGGAGRGTR